MGIEGTANVPADVYHWGMKLEAPTFTIDFRLPPEHRWDSLLTNSWARRQSKSLCRAAYKQALQQMEQKLGVLAPVTHWLAARLAKVIAGDLEFFDDMNVWSKYAVGDLDQVIMANFAYEALLTGRLLRNMTGWCTSVAFYQSGLGMVHCRNLDWPIWQIKRATIILDCMSNAGSFQAISVPGLVGILSGVAKKRFSITLNSAPHFQKFVPNTGGWSAALLVRWIFENCSSYEEAVLELKRAPAFVPFYAMVVGPGEGQAAVVEVTTTGAGRVYSQPDYPIALANHYPGEMSDAEEWEDSLARQECVEARALKCRAKSLLGCFSVVNDEEGLVTFGGTVQSMVLHPQSGTVMLQQL
jgi:hypothetical protein